MPKFAANLTMLFTEAPFMERFALAKKYGFEYVEYLFPYAYPKEELKQALENNQLSQVLFNLPPGDWDKGERGIACLPDRVDEFKRSVEQAIDYANVLNVKQLNCLSGLTSPEYSNQDQWDTLVNNLSFAAKALNKHGITLMIEPINSKIDMPGFFIDTLDKTYQLLKEVNEPNLKIQFDIYHMQIMHGDLIRNIKNNISSIGHIQFADNPGRHQPGTGEINFERIFKRLDDFAYKGYVSAEYHPNDTTAASLNWLQLAESS